MADYSHLKIIQASKSNNTPLKCDMCNSQFNKMGQIKMHYINCHKKYVIDMPTGNEKDTVKQQTNSQAKNNKKTAPKIGRRKKTIVKIEKADIIAENTTETGCKREMCLTTGVENEKETFNVKKSCSQNQHSIINMATLDDMVSIILNQENHCIKMTTVDFSKKRIPPTPVESPTSNGTSFECDLCSSKFNEIAYYKSHYVKYHKKCIEIESPEKNEKVAIGKRTASQTDSYKETNSLTENKTRTAIETENINEANIKTENSTETEDKSNNRNKICNVNKKLRMENNELEVCKSTFNSSLDLENHSRAQVQEFFKRECVNTAEDDKSKVCSECGECFALESAYKDHKLSHNIKCDHCYESFESLEAFLKTNTCSGEVYTVVTECEICGKVSKRYRIGSDKQKLTLKVLNSYVQGNPGKSWKFLIYVSRPGKVMKPLAIGKFC